MVVEEKSYPLRECNLPTMGVQIIRTGVENGLSAPIDLETHVGNAHVNKFIGEHGQPLEMAYTTLETAYSILDTLEKRETAAYGSRPDLAKIPDGGFRRQQLERFSKEAERLGWGDEEFNVEMPSSQWVDTRPFPKCQARGLTYAEWVIRRGRDYHQHLDSNALRRFRVRHYSISDSFIDPPFSLSQSN